MKRVIVSVLCLLLMTGCGAQKTGNDVKKEKPTASPKATATPVPTATPKPTPKPSTKPEYTEEPTKANGENQYGTIYEAEDAVLEGLSITNSGTPKFSGKGYVGNFSDKNKSRVDFYVDISEEGFYDVTVMAAYTMGYKENILNVNDNASYSFSHEEGKEFVPNPVSEVYLEKGRNKLSITPNWGWFLVDSICVKKSPAPDLSYLNVTGELINKNASDNAKRLMNFLADNYGKKIITGQYAAGNKDNNNGMESKEFKAINQLTGDYPAIMGLDMIEYSPSRVKFGSVGNDTERAIDFWNKGGIVTFAWHWNAPKDLINTAGHEWYRGFYTDSTNFNLEDAINKKDKEGYNLLLSDIDAIAVQLKKLQDAGVPVLWRPLHEASGGWFWWGAKGPEPYKKLWILMYDRLTNYHKLNNLIWVWNGQKKDWYPGDQYVDIIGEDIYAKENSYSSQNTKFKEAVNYTNKHKIVALSENGVVPDIDLMFRDHANWSWFATWNGEFVVNSAGMYSEKYTEEWVVTKMYSDKRAITLSRLPDLKKYRLN